jgi:hypothetical protein
MERVVLRIIKLSEDGTKEETSKFVGDEGQTPEEAFQMAAYFLSGQWDETDYHEMRITKDKDTGRSVAEDLETGDVYRYTVLQGDTED